MSSLTCKLVFYRPKHNEKEDTVDLNFKFPEMQKWNIPKDRAQRVETKVGVICLDILFTAGVMVIKMSKMANLYFLVMTIKI